MRLALKPMSIKVGEVYTSVNLAITKQNSVEVFCTV